MGDDVLGAIHKAAEKGNIHAQLLSNAIINGHRHVKDISDIKVLDLCNGSATPGKGISNAHLVTDETLKHLYLFPSLESLNLGTTGVRNPGAADSGLRELPNLTALQLHHLPLSDQAIADLAQLRSDHVEANKKEIVFKADGPLQQKIDVAIRGNSRPAGHPAGSAVPSGGASGPDNQPATEQGTDTPPRD